MPRIQKPEILPGTIAMTGDNILCVILTPPLPCKTTWGCLTDIDTRLIPANQITQITVPNTDANYIVQTKNQAAAILRDDALNLISTMSIHPDSKNPESYIMITTILKNGIPNIKISRPGTWNELMAELRSNIEAENTINIMPVDQQEVR